VFSSSGKVASRLRRTASPKTCDLSTLPKHALVLFATGVLLGRFLFLVKTLDEGLRGGFLLALLRHGLLALR
jgi:hypothetical protein